MASTESDRAHPSERPSVDRQPGNGLSQRLAIAVLLLGALLIAGCGKDTDAEDPNGPSASAPVDDARGRAEKLAVAAYQGMWKAYAEAGRTANPDDPALDRYAGGQALKTLKDGLAALRAKGEVLKGEYGSSPRAEGASPAPDPSTVTVVDCLNDEKFLTYKASGEPANDEPGGRRSTRATVTLTEGGSWKVTGFGVQAVGSC